MREKRFSELDEAIKKRTWAYRKPIWESNKPIREAKAAELAARTPYAVLYEAEGREWVFGHSERPDGGSALQFAKLVGWAKTPRVVVVSEVKV